MVTYGNLSATSGSYNVTTIVMMSDWRPDPGYWAVYAAREAGYCGA